jgi:hypothetical protein
MSKAAERNANKQEEAIQEWIWEISQYSQEGAEKKQWVIPFLLRQSSIESTRSTMVALATKGSVITSPPLSPPPPLTLTADQPKSQMEMMIC